VAQPLRFRRAPGRWSADRVRSQLERPLDENLGATAGDPWFSPPPGYDARRFDMDDGSFALFCWTDDDADPPPGADGGSAGYWLGNTETPSELWRTDKYGFDEVAYPISRWVQRELLAGLHDDEPWLAAYPHVSWYFLPVFCSKDGAETTRAFFRDHAAGFPDATREEGTGFVEETLRSGALDDYRETMAGKLGTSASMDIVRMSATIAEFTAARILTDSGYDVIPEIEVTTGHSLDFRATDPETGRASLVEVTRPQPVSNRSATGPSRRSATPRRRRRAASWKHTAAASRCSWTAPPSPRTTGPRFETPSRRSGTARPSSCAHGRTGTWRGIRRGRFRSTCPPRSTGCRSPRPRVSRRAGRGAIDSGDESDVVLLREAHGQCVPKKAVRAAVPLRTRPARVRPRHRSSGRGPSRTADRLRGDRRPRGGW